jgi:hypothetical protein
MTLPEALAQLCPGAGWVLQGDTYEGLTWLDKTWPPPSREDIEAAMAMEKAAAPDPLRVELDALKARLDTLEVKVATTTTKRL